MIDEMVGAADDTDDVTVVETLEERARLGAAWLDGRVPDWWTHVELTQLDQKWPSMCVVTQVCRGVQLQDDPYGVGFFTVCCDYYGRQRSPSTWPEYAPFVRRVFGLDDRVPYRETVQLGFALSHHEARSARSEELWAELTAAWAAEVTRRRITAPAGAPT